MLDFRGVSVGPVTRLELDGVSLLPSQGNVVLTITDDDSYLDAVLVDRFELLRVLFPGLFGGVVKDMLSIVKPTSGSGVACRNLVMECPAGEGRMRRYDFSSASVESPYRVEIGKSCVSVIPVQFLLHQDSDGIVGVVSEFDVPAEEVVAAG